MHQPHEVTATSGTVGDIYVVEDEAISIGDSLFELDDVQDTAKKDELLSEREDETDALNEMLSLEQSGEILSTLNGTIADINVSDNTEVTKSSSSLVRLIFSASSSSTKTGGTGGMTATVRQAEHQLPEQEMPEQQRIPERFRMMERL